MAYSDADSITPRGFLKPIRAKVILAISACLLLLVVARMAPAQDVKITPADVMVRVSMAASSVEILRVEMGKPRDTRPPLTVENAEPREVYFQTLSLFEKANRLAQEHTRQRSVKPAQPRGVIMPADVHNLVDLAIARLDVVREKYKMPGKPQSKTRDGTHTPSDVYAAVVQVNRQLSMLLEQQVAPADVFQQVTQAMGHAGAVLETLPGVEAFPAAPAFERGKKPLDVYNRLAECHRLQREIATLAGDKMVKIQQLESDFEGEIKPSDVYDLASQIIAELAHLHSRVPDAAAPRSAYFPGRKFPSHVYQRAGILRKQLQQLKNALEEDATWLKPTSG